MSDSYMDRYWRRRVLLQTLIYWTFIGLCCAGHRPFDRADPPQHSRLHDRWAQRIQYPKLTDRGTQRIEYPSINDRGQMLQYPSIDDSDASSQIQVKVRGCDMLFILLLWVTLCQV